MGSVVLGHEAATMVKPPSASHSYLLPNPSWLGMSIRLLQLLPILVGIPRSKWLARIVSVIQI